MIIIFAARSCSRTYSIPKFPRIVTSTPEFLVRNLLLGIMEGDESAFEVFYRMERNNLVHFVASYVKDTQTAEDIAQETLLKVWENRGALDPKRNLRAFTFTIARNRTLDYLRTYKPHASLAECEALCDPSLDGLIETLDLERLVRKTFLALPPKVRDTFLSSRREGMRYREIALEEGVSEKTVENRIGTALKAFRKVFR